METPLLTFNDMNHKQLLEVNLANVLLALNSIGEMVERRGLVLTAKPDARVPVFDSKHQAKKFRKRMNRVITHATMRTVNSFLRHFDGAKVTYTAREQKIIDARKAYVAARKATRDAYTAYLREKGSFYGGRVKVAPEESLTPVG